MGQNKKEDLDGVRTINANKLIININSPDKNIDRLRYLEKH